MFVILIIGTAGFLVSLLLHIAIWRVFKPKKQLLLLAVIFVILPLIIYFLLLGLHVNYFNLVNTLLILILHIGLSGVYVMTYPTMQADCPTLKIILEVSKSMPQGLTQEDIENIFTDDKLFNDRVEDLLSEEFIFLKNNKIYLTRKGSILSGFFLGYRNLLGLPVGEG